MHRAHQRRTATLGRAALLLVAAAAVAACGDADTDDDERTMGGEADVDGLVPGDTDLIDYACTDPGYVPGECAAPEESYVEMVSARHISEPEPIAYEFTPPSSGPHRPNWAAWGEYEYLPPQRYLHNLEHGGAAFLYNPCAEDAVVDALRDLARTRPDDEAGDFRWVLTPYPGLPTDVAVVTWEWTWSANCVDADAIGAFLDEHYRQAPEDVSSSGTYNRLWIGR